MIVELIVLSESRTCARAETIWRGACTAIGSSLEVVDAGSDAGRAHVARLRLGALPVLLVDRRMAFVGIPTHAQAIAILRRDGS